jgi:CheY-like chemotaxis protein
MSALGLLRKTPQEDRRQAHRSKVEMIERSARRMARLIDDLADLSSIQAGRLALKPRVQEAAPLVFETVASFDELARERRLSLRAEIAGEPPPVNCDRDRVLQVFSNLVGNAVSVTPEGGSIVLRAEGRGGEVVFSVSDTGPGIAQQELDRIFERYWRGERPTYKGTGLGLSIAKGIVDAHGGRIWAESALGVGTTFFFAVPATGPSLAAPPKAAGQSPARGTASGADEHRTILVVDDDPDVRDSMTIVLQAAGFEVDTAADGGQALRRLQEARKPPSLVFLDLTMPVMDGWTFLALRAKDPQLAAIPIVVVSGIPDLEGLTASLDVAACYRKPLEAVGLVGIAHRFADAAPDPQAEPAERPQDLGGLAQSP